MCLRKEENQTFFSYPSITSKISLWTVIVSALVGVEELDNVKYAPLLSGG